MGLTYYWIAAAGICFIFKYGTILQKFREYTTRKYITLLSLYNCCLCMGFWAGVILTPLVFLTEKLTIELLAFPFTTACLSWFADNLITILMNGHIYLKNLSDGIQQQTQSQMLPQTQNHPLRKVEFNQSSKGGMIPNVNPRS